MLEKRLTLSNYLEIVGLVASVVIAIFTIMLANETIEVTRFQKYQDAKNEFLEATLGLAHFRHRYNQITDRKSNGEEIGNDMTEKAVKLASRYYLALASHESVCLKNSYNKILKEMRVLEPYNYNLLQKVRGFKDPLHVYSNTVSVQETDYGFSVVVYGKGKADIESSFKVDASDKLLFGKLSSLYSDKRCDLSAREEMISLIFRHSDVLEQGVELIKYSPPIFYSDRNRFYLDDDLGVECLISNVHSYIREIESCE